MPVFIFIRMDDIPEIYLKDILVLGCGNTLFGDDGFGPEVCDYIGENFDIPSNSWVEDCGTGVREILFNLLLSSRRPERIIIVDSTDKGRKPGEVFEIEIEEMPEIKMDDFSLHHTPSSNLLGELRDTGVDIKIVSCQVENVPEQVSPGLSQTVLDAVPKAAGIIVERYF